jgi:hypothetical protein
VKVNNLISGQISTFTIIPHNGGEFKPAPGRLKEVDLIQDSSTDQVLLVFGNESVRIKGKNRRDRRLIEDVLDSGSRQFSWILSKKLNNDKINEIVIQNHLFRNQASLPDSFRIGVDEKIYDSFQKSFLDSRMPDPAKLDRIRDLFLIKPSGSKKARLQIMLSAADASIGAQSFAIIGNKARAVVKLDKDSTWYIDHLHRSNRIKEHILNTITIVEADIDFVDFTEAGKFVAENQDLLKTLENTGDSWVQLWDQYNGIEKDQADKLASKVGWYAYSNVERTQRGWEFDLVERDSTMELIEKLPLRAQLECGVTPPENIRNDRPTKTELRPNSRTRAPLFIGEFDEYDPRDGKIVISHDDDDNIIPPPDGYIYLSQIGTIIRHQRRVDALQDIRDSRSPMKQLQFILEDLPFRAVRQAFKIGKLRADIVTKVFNGKPTDRQTQAIKKALQTPDIALIQGPPGTGKTRVIAGIINHLLYEAQDRDTIEGNILVCSEQHDAVTNVAGVSSVYGIPAPIIGGKDAKQYHGISAQIEGWRRGKIREIEEKLYDFPDSPIEELRRRLKSQITGYFIAPLTPGELVTFLNEIIVDTQELIPVDLLNQLYTIKHRYSLSDSSMDNLDSDQEACLIAIRRIRTTIESFEDDGAENLLMAVRRLENLGFLSDSIQKKYEEILLKEPTPSEPSFLKSLQIFKEEMIDLIQDSSASVKISGFDKEVHATLIKVSNAILGKSRGVLGGPGGVLQRYREDLENDPFGVQETLRNYAFVLASTTQQSRSRRMMEAKLGTVRDGYEFDTVIIDEAARANPLDLLIPMSLAKRRIILVGDHKQLPHIVDPIIERQLLSALDKTQDPSYALHVSLFEKLFHRLKETEAKDGIVRTVTLDRQFRMHPQIGEFVSKHFYQKEGLSSGLPAENFEHGISGYEGKCLSWFDVPYSRGRERPGKSKSRQVEADLLAKELVRICIEHPELSIGVITFYKSQVGEILRALSKTDPPITEKSGKHFEIREPYKFVEHDDATFGERLRVGTVDAFQGMEFDVVFLSVVRSNNIHLTADKLTWIRKYGFITVENRLCVAMSRAKKLLISVGDREMFNHDLANEAIPSLAELSRVY